MENKVFSFSEFVANHQRAYIKICFARTNPNNRWLSHQQIAKLVGASFNKDNGDFVFSGEDYIMFLLKWS